MFETLSGRLGDIFDRLTRRGALSEGDVDAALREIRVALLEADVALPVAKSFVARVRARAVGARVLASVTPGQMVVKTVHDCLVEALGGEPAPLSLAAGPPAVAMMVGLQGSGKTTTTAKLARRLTLRDRKKTLVASLDVNRPAAQEQLAQLAARAGVDALPVVAGQPPAAIAERALRAARLGGFDVLLLDTAGRLHIDEASMAELEAVRAATDPVETLLVADALTGQDAVNLARVFGERAGVTGIVLTRIDGDGRGGAALSMKETAGCPIKLAGTGEGLDALEEFHPDRIASRILGMGDVVSLVEKAAAAVEQGEADALARRIDKGRITLDDFATQLRQLRARPASRTRQGATGARRPAPRRCATAPSRSHPHVDDPARARQRETAQRLAQAADRRRVGNLGAGRKPAAQAIQGNADDDEADEEMGRPRPRPVRRAGRRPSLRAPAGLPRTAFVTPPTGMTGTERIP